MLEDLDLTAGIVRILNFTGVTVGTGFVATDDGLIVTCAHVVEAASCGPGDVLPVVFHGHTETRYAKVLSEGWLVSSKEDIAVLSLKGDLPQGVSALSIGQTYGCAGHRFRAFGYAQIGEIEGVWATGEIKGKVRLPDGRDLLQLASPELDRGISGGPVLDLVRQQVVGIVTAVYYPDAALKHRDTALATPAETLYHAYPDIPLLQVPLRELFVGKGALRLSRLFNRRVWGIILARLRTAVLTRPVRSAIGAVVLVIMLMNALFGVRAYLNRGWRAIPGGQALLGRPDGNCNHSVEPFEIQITEVTNAEYLKCMKAGVCASPKSIWEVGPDGWIYQDGLDQHPVWGLSWEDANAYCRFIGARLPTEAEWVRAARRGSVQLYPWGDIFTTEYANVFESGVGNSVAVKAYPKGRNMDGLYHLSGNVREWVSDRAIDPCDFTAGEGEHVAKGSSFQDSFENATLWVRFQADELPYVGVRCVRD